MNLTSFENAFDVGTGSAVVECCCGRTFYNPDQTWDWEEEELERLEDDKNSTACDYTISRVNIDDIEYVMQCDCWHRRATEIMELVDKNAYGIASYLAHEKRRKQEEADRMPTVSDL